MSGETQRLQRFLFPAATSRWLALLRVGLGLQVVLYVCSLGADWRSLYGMAGHGLVNRALSEAVLSAESTLTPRFGWLIKGGGYLGLSDASTLSLLWWSLLVAGALLLLGLFCRWAALAAWFLYLCSVKSGMLFAYGVDNFTTIGLFYLMIAPLPDAWSLDWSLRGKRPAQPARLGFHRRILQLHLCLIYFFGGLSKALGLEWWNGNSVWRALIRPPFDLVSPDLLLRFASLLPLLGILVFGLELGYPFFIWPRRTRPFWLAGILAMHFSIGLTMGLFLFALIMIVLNLAAFGPEYLPRVRNMIRSRRKRGDDSPARVEAKLEGPG